MDHLSQLSPTERGHWITVEGARTHNLKQIDVELPRDALIVVTGLNAGLDYFESKVEVTAFVRDGASQERIGEVSTTFRMVGPNDKVVIERFDDPKVEVWQIGTEGGFLRAPVKLTRILMAPAERADVIVDFSRVKFGTNVTLLNMGPDAPFAGGGFRRADPQSTGLVMQFRVNQPLGAVDDTTPPEQLVMPALSPLTGGLVRSLALLEMESEPPAAGLPIEARLGTFDPTMGAPDGIVFKRWEDEETENPAPGTTEVWELYNFTADAHRHGSGGPAPDLQPRDVGRRERPVRVRLPPLPAHLADAARPTVK